MRKPKKRNNNNLTKRKKIEEALRKSEEHYRIFASYQHAISELHKFYVVEAPFEQMVQRTLDSIIEKFGYYMAWYAELIEKEKVILPKLWAGKYEKYLDGLRLEYEGDKRDAKCAMSLAILRKKPFGYADLEHDKDFEKWRDFALQYGYRSNQAIPLIIDGKCKSAFLIYSTRPRAFSEELVQYLKGIVDELAMIVENITKRKQAEEALRRAHDELEVRVQERTAELAKAHETLVESEEKYRTQFEEALDAIFIADAKTGTLIDCNRAATRLVGRKKSELVGKHQRILHPPEESTGDFTRTFKQHLKEKMGQVLEAQVITKKGEIKDVAIKANLFEFKGKKALQGIFRDITERKKAGERLRASEEKFRELAELLPETIYEFDETGYLTFVNRAAFAMFGFTQEDFKEGLTALQMLVPEDRDRAKENISKVLGGEKLGGVEYTAQRKDGSAFPIIIYSSAIIREGKSAGLRGIIVDITERKKTEEVLRKSGDKYRTLLENLSQKIFFKDRNSVYISCNENYARDLKIKSGEIAGKTDYDFFPKELAEKYRADDKRIMESGETEDIEERYIQEEQEVIAHTVKTPVKDEEDNVFGILGIFWDITERKRMEERLAQSEKLATVGRLAAGVAHEINNPITSALLNVQRMSNKMKKKVKTIPDVKVYVKTLEKVEGAIYRCRRIVTELLVFSRPTKFELAPTNINKVIKETLESLEEQVKTRDIKVVKALAPQLPRIMADREQLSQVFSNLIMNGCEAMPKGGRLRITTRLQKPEVGARSGRLGEGAIKLVEIEVSDMGKGISKENLPKIFDPFFTTKETGKGVGLGLSISHRIIEEHKGTIEARSQKGKGTTFIIRFPAVKKAKSKINA